MRLELVLHLMLQCVPGLTECHQAVSPMPACKWRFKIFVPYTASCRSPTHLLLRNPILILPHRPLSCINATYHHRGCLGKASALTSICGFPTKGFVLLSSSSLLCYVQVQRCGNRIRNLSESGAVRTLRCKCGIKAVPRCVNNLSE